MNPAAAIQSWINRSSALRSKTLSAALTGGAAETVDAEPDDPTTIDNPQATNTAPRSMTFIPQNVGHPQPHKRTLR
ncbi:hypothetical protein GCM10022235_69570 [Kribbella ginsengisoli]|uniref:Uncharacterized protein n=1 Tax=Kribbella ginsengisoli TaxID=363865 RepID=A0ABP6YQH4_9ACTN